jgi:hypothetical protein
MSNDPAEHPLRRPDTVIVLALFGIIAFGVGLMVVGYITVGWAFALFGTTLTLSLYFDTLRHLEQYRLRWKELAFVISIMMVGILIPSYVYFVKPSNASAEGTGFRIVSSARILMSTPDPNRTMTMFFAARKIGDKYIAEHIQLLLWLKIYNGADKTFTIVDYSLEQNVDGRWRRLCPVDIDLTPTYWGMGSDPGVLPVRFDSLSLQRKDITMLSAGLVNGWTAWQCPVEYNCGAGELRITIMTADGRRFVQKLSNQIRTVPSAAGGAGIEVLRGGKVKFDGPVSPTNDCLTHSFQ